MIRQNNRKEDNFSWMIRVYFVYKGMKDDYETCGTIPKLYGKVKTLRLSTCIKICALYDKHQRNSSVYIYILFS